MSKKGKKKNRTSLIANLWLLKHAIDRSIAKKKTAGERH